MPLNPKQKAAVEYLSGPLLVLAGPGTGKTQLLSAKVAYILENTDASPENILCITFTEAGAENMRDRLRSMIGKAAEQINIHTYHAFGKVVLDRYQNYAENPGRKLDETIDDITKFKIITNIQQTLSALDILKTANTKDIIDAIDGAKSARLQPSDLVTIANQNTEDGIEISNRISPILESAKKGARAKEAIANTYEPILAELVEFTSSQNIVQNIERIANTMARELKNILDSINSAEKPTVKPLTSWRDKFFERADNGTYRLADTIANKKTLSLANIFKQYEDYLSDNNLYDFNDMIEYAINYLKNDRGFRLTLSEQFQYILLDEFQDTNNSQAELIKLLSDYENPSIMAVGDDDQAIFAFQGANASNLINFKEHYNAEVISLDINYRSTGEILSLSRHIADQISDSFTKSYPDINKNLSSHKDSVDGLPDISGLSRHEFSCKEAEYAWIAKSIEDLIKNGEDPTEIAVLAPKHQNLIEILPFLKNKNIDITYEKRDNILLNPSFLALTRLAEFIYQLSIGQSAAHMLPEVLAFEFFNLPADKIICMFEDVRHKKPTLEYIADDFPELTSFFANLAVRANDTPLELWLNYLIGAASLQEYTSPFLSYHEKTLSEAELLEFYECLSTFRDAILNHKKNENITLKDFVETLHDYQTANSEITRISTFRDSDHAVQVMTAFKSKGLEFKHVFLISADNNCWGMGKGNNNFLALPKNLTPIRHTGATPDEKLRVLFVAATRAKRFLTITNSTNNSSGKRLDRLEYLNESSPEDIAQVSPFLPEAVQNIQMHCDNLTNSEKIQNLSLSWAARYASFTPKLENIIKNRLENYKLSATDLTSFLNLVYAGPEELYKRLILRVPQSTDTIEQVYGTLIHKIFEDVTTQKLDDTAAIAHFHELVPHTILPPDEQDTLNEYGEHNLKIALQAFGDILRHSHAKAEINLAPEHPALDGIPLTGKIDHLNIDPENKTIEIYDFKTGRFRKSGWEVHPTNYFYSLQLGFYKLLLNLSPTYSKYQITRGHILYVTPDAEDKVYDKVYEYTESKENELKNLVVKVHELITSLRFINDPDIFRPANAEYGMKQIREFIDLILTK